MKIVNEQEKKIIVQQMIEQFDRVYDRQLQRHVKQIERMRERYHLLIESDPTLFKCFDTHMISTCDAADKEEYIELYCWLTETFPIADADLWIENMKNRLACLGGDYDELNERDERDIVRKINGVIQ